MVAITDMKMPKQCDGCIFFDWRNSACIEGQPFLNCNCELLAKLNRAKMERYQTKWWIGHEHSSTNGVVLHKHMIYPDERWKDCPLKEI